MAFDRGNDVTIAETTVPSAKRGERITVGIYSYNGGEPKIGLTRTFGNGGGKLGRMTVGETRDVYAVLGSMIAKATIATAKKAA